MTLDSAPDTQTLMTAAETTESVSSTTASPPEGSTDPKVAGDQQPAPAADTSPAEDQPAPSEEAPADIAYEFTFEEGVEVDPVVLDDLKGLSKEFGLTKEQAQQVANLGAKQAQKWAAAQEAAIAEASASWIEQVKSDKEIGGDKLSENLAIAKRALNRFGSPELTALLNDSRLGNHPELIRAFHRIGKAISDDALVPGGRSTNGAPDPARRLYDNSNLA